MKKKCFIYLLGMFLSFNALYSALPFRIERLGTDYNGVIEVNNRIIAYGNNGVLTYSDDFGDSWKQINLGEFNNILKIIKDDENNLFALAPKSILLSKDGGNNWTQKTILKNQTMLDFAIVKDAIYFITKNSIGVIDKGLKTAPQIFLQFEDFLSFSKCELLDKYLFAIESGYYIYRIDLETKQIDTIDLHTKIKMGSYYRNVANIKISGSILYVLVADGLSSQIEAEYHNIRHLVIKSTDYGNTWEYVTSKVPVTKDFLIENDGSVATLAPICFCFGEKFPYFGISFVRIKDEEFTEYIQKDSSGIWFPYFRGGKNFNKHRINNIARIRDSLIIAVGGNKTILISRDNGVNWEMKSFFRPIFKAIYGRNRYDVQALNGDTLVVTTNTIPFCFVSTDRGATFLPISREQALSIDSSLIDDITPFSFYLRRFGFLGHKRIKQGNIISQGDILTAIFSNDLGRTFSKVDYQIGDVIYNDSVVSLIHNEVSLEETNEFLLSIMMFHTIKEYTGPRYLLCRFDDGLRLIDTTLFYSYFYDILPYLGELIFSDATYIFKSSDYGKTMVTLSKFPRSSYYISNDDYVNNNALGIIKDNLLIYESTPISGRLLKYNLTSNSFDSLSWRKVSNKYLLTFNDTAFISTELGMYIFPNIQNNFSEYDLVPVDDIASGRVLITSSVPYRTSNSILTLELVDLAETFDLGTYTPLNLAILRRDSPYLWVEPNVEEDFVYLFAFPPYPNPAQDLVNVRVFWDSLDPNRSVNIDVFDAYGQKLNLPLEFKEGNQSALISVNTSSLALGTYYMRINYGYKTIVCPVLIIK